MPYYIEASHGDTFADKTAHRARDCPDGSTRPIAQEHVESMDRCPECARGESESEVCDTVKSDGEVCGRDLPCGYHS